MLCFSPPRKAQLNKSLIIIIIIIGVYFSCLSVPVKCKWLDLWDFSLMYKISYIAWFIYKGDEHICSDKEDTDGCRQIQLIQHCCSHSESLSMACASLCQRWSKCFACALWFFPMKSLICCHRAIIQVAVEMRSNTEIVRSLSCYSLHDNFLFLNKG